MGVSADQDGEQWINCVAVKELRLNYHNRDIYKIKGILMDIYQIKGILNSAKLIKCLNSNPVNL